VGASQQYGKNPNLSQHHLDSAISHDPESGQLTTKEDEQTRKERAAKQFWGVGGGRHGQHILAGSIVGAGAKHDEFQPAQSPVGASQQYGKNPNLSQHHLDSAISHDPKSGHLTTKEDKARLKEEAAKRFWGVGGGRHGQGLLNSSLLGSGTAAVGGPKGAVTNPSRPAGSVHEPHLKSSLAITEDGHWSTTKVQAKTKKELTNTRGSKNYEITDKGRLGDYTLDHHMNHDHKKDHYSRRLLYKKAVPAHMETSLGPNGLVGPDPAGGAGAATKTLNGEVRVVGAGQPIAGGQPPQAVHPIRRMAMERAAARKALRRAAAAAAAVAAVRESGSQGGPQAGGSGDSHQAPSQRSDPQSTREKLGWAAVQPHNLVDPANTLAASASAVRALPLGGGAGGAEAHARYHDGKHGIRRAAVPRHMATALAPHGVYGVAAEPSEANTEASTQSPPPPPPPPPGRAPVIPRHLASALAPHQGGPAAAGGGGGPGQGSSTLEAHRARAQAPRRLASSRQTDQSFHVAAPPPPPSRAKAAPQATHRIHHGLKLSNQKQTKANWAFG